MRWTRLPEFEACPDGWEVVALTTKADFIAGQSPDSKYQNNRAEGVPFLQGNADFGARYPSPTVHCTQPTKVCEPGDTLISVRAPVGAINRADQVYGLGRGLAAIHATSVEPDYLYYAMMRWHQPLKRAAQGSTFDAITSRQFRQLLCCLPKSGPERLTISERLATADDALATAASKLSAAKRIKKAVMQNVFTRGIPGRHNRFQKTKIGEIPEEWNLCAVSNVLAHDIYNGVSPQSRPEPPGTPILNVSCISDGYCRPAKVTYVDLFGNPDDDLLAKKGDFFVLRGNGNRDSIASGGLLDEQPPSGCVFSDLLIKIPFDPNYVVDGFMPFLWQSTAFLHRLQSKAVSGSGLWKIGLREIRKHKFPCPPKDEQSEIVRILNSCENVVRLAETEMNALMRLRTSLLQNLLTGKVRVRV